METIVQAPVLYTTIHKLPLSRFIDALCDGEYKALIITGEPSEEDLNSAWGDILEQYLEASAGSRQIQYIKALAELKRLEVKFNMAVSLINLLRECFVQRFADRLNSLLNCKYIFDIKNLEEYDALLDKCYSKSKYMRLQMELKKNEIKAMNEEAGGPAAQPKREDFSKTLIALSDHAGRELYEDTTTVYVFCERVKRYNKYIESQSK